VAWEKPSVDRCVSNVGGKNNREGKRTRKQARSRNEVYERKDEDMWGKP
jgi:hypothetical protein